jgi:hypothetical protein
MLSTLDTCEATTARSCWRLEMPALLAMRRKVKKFHHYFHHYPSSLQQVVVEQASNNVKVLSIRYAPCDITPVSNYYLLYNKI